MPTLNLKKEGAVRGGQIYYDFTDHEHVAWRAKAKLGTRWFAKTFEEAGVTFLGEALNSSFYSYEWQQFGDCRFKLIRRGLADIQVEVKFANGHATVDALVNSKQQVVEITAIKARIKYGPLNQTVHAN